MGDERYMRESGTYDNGQGYAPDYDYQQPGYGEQQPSGFTRHQPGNARRIAAENPVAGAFKRVGGAVSGLFQNKRQGGAPGRAPRVAAVQGGDYLGVGDPCRVCGNPVDPGQSRCPHCGAFVKPLYQNILFWVGIVVLLAIVVVLSLAINSCNAGNSGEAALDIAVAGDAKDESTLLSVISSAQSKLDEQAVSRTYTRTSLNALQHAVDEANAVLAVENATADQISAAAAGIGNAMQSLVSLATDYPWPSYDELVSYATSALGTQVAVNGTVQEINMSEDGSASMSVAFSGDAASIVYVNFSSIDATAIPAAGDDCTATGVVIGGYLDCPVIYADSVQPA